MSKGGDEGSVFLLGCIMAVPSSCSSFGRTHRVVSCLPVYSRMRTISLLFVRRLSEGSDKNSGLQNKRETPTVKRNENLLNHRRRTLSCTYKYRLLSRFQQPQAYPRWNRVFKKQVNRQCE